MATVSPTGLVTAVGPGQATIFADVNPRGTQLIRVFPEFQGSWLGSWVSTGCSASASLVGICPLIGLQAGQVNPLEMALSQTDAAVDGSVTFGSFTPNNGTGSVSIGGELRLAFGAAPATAAGGFVFRLRPSAWVSQATVPGRMTGTFQLEMNVDGFTGVIVVGGELRNTNTQAATMIGAPADLLKRLPDALRQLRDSAR